MYAFYWRHIFVIMALIKTLTLYFSESLYLLKFHKCASTALTAFSFYPDFFFELCDYFKNLSLEHYDVTAANLRYHTVYSFYQPAQLAYSVIDGKGYVVSVDTGKMTTYTQAQHGYAFNDGVRARVAWSGKSLNRFYIN